VQPVPGGDQVAHRVTDVGAGLVARVAFEGDEHVVVGLAGTSGAGEHVPRVARRQAPAEGVGVRALGRTGRTGRPRRGVRARTVPRRWSAAGLLHRVAAAVAGLARATQEPRPAPAAPAAAAAGVVAAIFVRCDADGQRALGFRVDWEIRLRSAIRGKDVRIIYHHSPSTTASAAAAGSAGSNNPTPARATNAAGWPVPDSPRCAPIIPA
jgi:hypothetical protein